MCKTVVVRVTNITTVKRSVEFSKMESSSIKSIVHVKNFAYQIIKVVTMANCIKMVCLFSALAIRIHCYQ